jgi:hypothetical protein
VSIKFLRLISFGGLCVQALGFGNDHVKHDGEGFHNHHAHSAMVLIFEAKVCVTWCSKRFQYEDHTYISGSMDKNDNDVFKMPCTTSVENSWTYLDFQKLDEVYVPTNQASRQSEVPTSRYGRITDGCTC